MLAGAVGLALAHGFREPIVADAMVRAVLAASIGLFALSRLLMLVPVSVIRRRLARWWVDFVLLTAAGLWWLIDREKAPVILSVAAMYSIAIGAGVAGRAGVRRLIGSGPGRPIATGVGWLFLTVAGLALVGGAVLTLPRCCEGWYPVSSESTYPGQASYELLDHGLDCLFTATAAVTGTGLAVYDVGYRFSRAGQIVVLVLMQIGGLAILTVGAVVGWRLRRLIGWHAADDDASPAGLRRLITFVWIATLVIEAAGTAVLFIRPVAGAAHVSDPWADRLFDASFHAVSAFCNVGITLPRNSLIACRHAGSVYAVLLPLMVLGSIGGPVAYELCRRLTRRGGHGLRQLSTDGAVTLAATAGLILLGAGLLFGIESTCRWQLRYRRDDTPGRAGTPATHKAEGTMIFSSEGSARVRSERMRTMSGRPRAAAAVVHSIAARTGGMHTARLDELSLTPASRVMLMGWMLMGGAVGGSAGGLRIAVVLLLITKIGTVTYLQGRERGTGRLSRRSILPRQRAIVAAAAVATSMFAVIGLTTFVLVYRQAGSLEASLFEAVSACCNVGFSTGLTRQLGDVSVVDRLAGQSALMLAMVLGRVLPLGILLRSTAVRKRG